MLNKSDIIFVVVSLLIICISYYWMIVRKVKEDEETSDIGVPNEATSNINAQTAKDDQRQKTKGELAKEARKREKKAQKEVS